MNLFFSPQINRKSQYRFTCKTWTDQIRAGFEGYQFQMIYTHSKMSLHFHIQHKLREICISTVRPSCKWRSCLHEKTIFLLNKHTDLHCICIFVTYIVIVILFYKRHKQVFIRTIFGNVIVILQILLILVEERVTKWSRYHRTGQVRSPNLSLTHLHNVFLTSSNITWIVELYWLQIQNFMLLCDILLCPMHVYEMLIPFRKDK